MVNILRQSPNPIPLEMDSDWRNLEVLVSNTLSARLGINKPPMSEIRRHLESLSCSCAVLEYGYLDLDVLHDYLSDYGWFFDDCGRDCLRVHFFQKKPFCIPKESSTKWIQELYKSCDCRRSEFSTDNNPYLGYMVIRPTGKFCVGRTILMDRLTLSESQADDQPVIHTIHTRRPYHVHLCGATLEVVGTPFMQQDGSRHMCASAAMWTLAYDLHRRFGVPRLFANQITQMATANVLRSDAAQGLTPQEHTRFLRQIGCAIDATMVRIPDKQGVQRNQAVQLIADVLYGYIESNAPVLLAYWFRGASVGHTVLAIGHDLLQDRKTPHNVRFTTGKHRIQLASDYVANFYVQDDGRGPYQQMRIWNKKGKALTHQQGNCKDIHAIADAQMVMIIPGIPAKLRVLYQDARKQVISSLLNPERYSKFEGLKEGVAGILKEARLRLYFQHSVRFRTLMTDSVSGRVGMNRVHMDAYLSMRLPRYLYVCDFCEPALVAGKRGWYSCQGELLLDATTPLAAQTIPWVSLRIGDTLLVAGHDEPIIDSDYDYSAPPNAPDNRDDYL